MKTKETRSSGLQRLQTSKHDSVQFLIAQLSFRFMAFLGACHNEENRSCSLWYV